MEIARDIKELLIEHGKVVIPNFGGFTSSYQPAVVDGITGQIHPPALQLAFDTNLQINDGLLVDFLRQKHRITATAAQDMIDAFVTDIQNLFSHNEIAVLPEVGRFYRDFSGKTQFLPDSTNFNTDAFGLPILHFEPISRQTRAAATSETTTVPQESYRTVVEQPKIVVQPSEAVSDSTNAQQPAAAESVPTTIESYYQHPSLTLNTTQPPARSWQVKNPPFWEKWKEWIPAAAATIVALSVITIWWLTSNEKAIRTEGGLQSQNDKPRINASPLGTPQNNAPKSDTGNKVNAAPSTTTPPPTPPEVAETPKKEEKPAVSKSFGTDKDRSDKTTHESIGNTTTKTGKKAVVVVGAFANKSYVQKAETWIKAQGYELSERKSSGLTVINCTFYYTDNAQFKRTMSRLREKFGEEITVTVK
jgi:hypothetical protein